MEPSGFPAHHVTAHHSVHGFLPESGALLLILDPVWENPSAIPPDRPLEIKAPEVGIEPQV